MLCTSIFRRYPGSVGALNGEKFEYYDGKKMLTCNGVAGDSTGDGLPVLKGLIIVPPEEDRSTKTSIH